VPKGKETSYVVRPPKTVPDTADLQKASAQQVTALTGLEDLVRYQVF
jgi:hypothetical protein